MGWAETPSVRGVSGRELAPAPYLDSAVGDFDTTYCCDPDAPSETVEFQDREGNTFTFPAPVQAANVAGPDTLVDYR